MKIRFIYPPVMAGKLFSGMLWHFLRAADPEMVKQDRRDGLHTRLFWEATSARDFDAIIHMVMTEPLSII